MRGQAHSALFRNSEGHFDELSRIEKYSSRVTNVRRRILSGGRREAAAHLSNDCKSIQKILKEIDGKKKMQNILAKKQRASALNVRL